MPNEEKLKNEIGNLSDKADEEKFQSTKENIKNSGIFSGITTKDWIIGLFTGWLWIFYKMYKNGAPIGKFLGGLILIGILGAIFGDKKPSTDNETPTTIEAKVDNTEDKTLACEDFKLGMDKSDIPSQIELVKGSKIHDFDDSFQYEDKNNNVIKIDDFEFTVKFVIRGDNNKVKSIQYNAKNINKDITESQLVELSKKFTDKPLKIRTMSNYTNNELSNIILEYSEINNGIEDDFRFIYGNDNANFDKNTIMVMHHLIDVKKSGDDMKKSIEKTVNDSMVVVEKGAYLCSSVDSYKRLVDCFAKKPNTYIPSDCFQTKEGNFIKALTDSYDGVNMTQIMGNGNKFYWVADFFIKKGN